MRDDVLIPTGLPRNCLSKPIMPPQRIAVPIPIQLKGVTDKKVSMFITYLGVYLVTRRLC